ncbi:cytochrome d ubiquinol oxidase subunit II [Streptomyces sirii]|uniref:cytochrome d ubiquinol oxidase subunit II n=1 Tax=Streptomyces sirii TaxID=3127701 RepID=UPI003D35C7C0
MAAAGAGRRRHRTARRRLRPAQAQPPAGRPAPLRGGVRDLLAAHAVLPRRRRRGIASGRAAPGTEPSAEAWSNPTSMLFGLLAVTTTAFLGAVFLAADARRFDAPDLDGYFRRRALIALAAVAVLAVITLFITHGDAPHVWHGLTHGVGLVFVVIAALATAATAWLLLRTSAAWSRVTAVGVVASAVLAWGMAQRPYLIPTSLTVAEGAGAPTTLRWLMLVSLVAVALVFPAVALLYWLDTHGELEALSDADLRSSGARDEG